MSSEGIPERPCRAVGVSGEARQLLDLMVHWSTPQDAFLRELISNASDALGQAGGLRRWWNKDLEVDT